MDPLAQPPSPINTVSPIRPKKSNKSLILAIVVILALTIGATLYMKSKDSSTVANVEPTPTVEPLPTEVVVSETPTPETSTTPTPEETTKPTSAPKPAATSAQTMNIQILNGSGETGVASTMKSHLEGKGYKYFETGNADNYDYTGVSIKIKSSAKQYLTTLQTDIGDKYTVSQDTGTLPNDSLFDAVVTVGK